MQEAFICTAIRTAGGRRAGRLSHLHPADLGGMIIDGVLDSSGVAPEAVDDVILGCVSQIGPQTFNIARTSVLSSRLPESVPGVSVDRQCGSSQQAMHFAAQAVLSGTQDLIIAGGVESMSMVPMTGNKLSASPEAMAQFPSVYTPMGITAENVAKKFEVSREEQDKFAVASHKKAAAAREAKKFEDEIVAVTGLRFEGNERKTFEFKVDEMIRPDTTLEGLASLKPAFSTTGSVTAGNSSPLSDGAAAALLMSREKANSLGIKGLGILKSYVTVGVDPSIMGIGPVPAIQKLLAKNSLKISDIDLFEVNEAFASQCVYAQKTLGIPDDRLNVNGGALALGHPLGCTGAKLTATALYELKRRGGKYAIVSMCIGGGMGAAALFERIA